MNGGKRTDESMHLRNCASRPAQPSKPYPCDAQQSRDSLVLRDSSFSDGFPLMSEDATIDRVWAVGTEYTYSASKT